VSGCVHGKVRSQTMKADLRLYMIDLPPGLDVCLGDHWMHQRKAIMNYDDCCVHLMQGKARCTLKCDDVSDLSPPPETNMPLLSAVQARHMIEKERCKAFLVTVSCPTDPDLEVNDKQTHTDPALQQILTDYESVFAPLPPGMPPERGVGHTIDTGNAPPVSRPMYRMSTKEKLEVEEHVKDLLAKGFIQPS
jgi:hypothetical protein